jgi:hypothetical protein
MRAGAGIGRFATAMAVLACAWTALATGAQPARADCLVLVISIGCDDTAQQQPTAPDPGGSESPDQPVPKPGKAWGFNLGYEPEGDTSPASSLQAMTALGVTHLRYAMHWRAFSDTSPGQPIPKEMRETTLGNAPPGSSLRQYDGTYLDLTARDITPVIIVMSVPIWASTLHDCADPMYQWLHGEQCPSGWTEGQHFPAPEYYPQWRAWTAAVAARYPRALIEGPNEPDHAWAAAYPGAVSARTAADIQCQLFGAVRSVDNRTVLSMGLYDPSYERAFIAPAKACYDVFSFHTYPGYTTNLGPGSSLAKAFDALRTTRGSAGDAKPIWVTETGFNSSDEAKYAPVARRLYNRLVTMPDVAGVLFHTLRDSPAPGDDDRFGFFDRWWTPKARACLFVAGHGGTWPGC